ncbi:hypothetical protein K435DRAFT_867581 [Dendrothele bispora CBS 962.96]|uniref:Xylanolytic transcriptional activator regulatory domain-containing protein n=1 Tax=Dendrothele bispora (strain CBS 962.96) TaxID=1314807 RepID=A0A4S8LF79_DENBC|nr:hypothetical protein K435DRAFT_867581 [Dendrothele bispora CBS 962.96]
MSAFGEGGFNFKRYLKATECTSFRISQALEARIRGHPATNVTEDEQSPLGTNILSQKHKPLSDILPERTLPDRLVGAFFVRVHPNFPIFHRKTFFIRYKAIWSPTSSSSTHLDPEPGRVCALMMTLVLGAQTLEDTTTSSSSHSGFLTLTQAQ